LTLSTYDVEERSTAYLLCHQFSAERIYCWFTHDGTLHPRKVLASDWGEFINLFHPYTP
jgi:hypothetical protein